MPDGLAAFKCEPGENPGWTKIVMKVEGEAEPVIVAYVLTQILEREGSENFVYKGIASAILGGDGGITMLGKESNA